MNQNIDKKLPLQLQELLIQHCKLIVGSKAIRLVCKTWKQIIDGNKTQISPNVFQDDNIINLNSTFPLVQAIDFTELGQVNDVTVTPLTKTTISSLQHVKALQTLNLSGQSLRHADYLYDVAQVTQIKELTLTNFFRVDVLARFVERARHLTKLSGLQIQANRDGAELLTALSKANNLRYLDMSLSAPFIFQQLYGQSVINSLQQIQGLKKLSLRGNILYFIEGLSSVFPRLHSLTLSLNFGVTLENIDHSSIQNLNLVKDLRVEVSVDQERLNLFENIRNIKFLRMDSMQILAGWMVWDMVKFQQNLQILEFAHPVEFETHQLLNLFKLPNLISLQNLNLKDDQIQYLSAYNIPVKLRELKLWINKQNIDQIGIMGDLTQLKNLHIGILQKSNFEQEQNIFVQKIYDGIQNLRNLENLGFELDFKQLVPNIVISMSILTSLTNLKIKCDEIFDPNKIIQEIGQLKNLRKLHIKVQHPKHSTAHNVISTVVPLSNLVNLRELVLKFLSPQNEHLKVLTTLTELRNLEVIFAKRYGDWNPSCLEEIYKMYPAIRTLTALAS
eukprot:TRINITY_DN9554_c0_g2_i8.p1 TRINITY_DN9554_c0_g2~~TRINITY_DN9554_c0_g2_i8.p1  ORF type:complete len:560 (+),score=80.22 TRINITY_DN9554_c0_g2_i8:67-1746(+)